MNFSCSCLSERTIKLRVCLDMRFVNRKENAFLQFCSTWCVETFGFTLILLQHTHVVQWVKPHALRTLHKHVL